jgi:hypothetical protein
MWSCYLTSNMLKVQQIDMDAAIDALLLLFNIVILQYFESAKTLPRTQPNLRTWKLGHEVRL